MTGTLTSTRLLVHVCSRPSTIGRRVQDSSSTSGHIDPSWKESHHLHTVYMMQVRAVPHVIASAWPATSRTTAVPGLATQIRSPSPGCAGSTTLGQQRLLCGSDLRGRSSCVAACCCQLRLQLAAPRGSSGAGTLPQGAPALVPLCTEALPAEGEELVQAEAAQVAAPSQHDIRCRSQHQALCVCTQTSVPDAVYRASSEKR